MGATCKQFSKQHVSTQVYKKCRCMLSSGKIDLFADPGFVSSVGWSFWVVSVPVKSENCSYKTLFVRLSKLSTVIVKLLSELAASVLWAANVVTMVFATSSITSCGGNVSIGDNKVMKGLPRLCGEVVDVVSERAQFLQELDSLLGRLVPEKMAEFLRETQRKDTERMLQLQILGRETELRAREKENFIQKLKGLVPF
ncbi:hypothetical protein Tco_0002432 [Tanacetum coccineum]